MKRFLKLFPAALAVVALASCSDTDLLTNGKNAPVAEEGDLIVTVDALEEGGVATRAYRDAAAKALVWAEGDELNVYDADLYKHDVYIANAAGKFEVDGKAILTAPQYALFPGEDVVRGYWNRSDDKVYAEFAIPQTLVYDENSEKVIDANGTVGYAANLPMWGTATKDGDQVKAHLRYLTAVLKINLTNAFGNANWLALRTHGAYTGATFVYDAGYDASTAAQLWGTFRAKLDATGAPDAFTDATKTEYTAFGAVALEKGEADLITGDALYIDLRKVPAQASCIYVPIIEGLDGDLDHISLSYSGESVASGDMVTSWTEIGCKFPNEIFKHNKLYETSWDFDLEDASPNALSMMLNQYKSTKEDIEFNLVKTFTIDADMSIVTGPGKYNNYDEIDLDTEFGNIIAIPALNDGVDVTINLTKNDKTGTAARAFSTWTNTAPTDLTFTDADAEAPFKGTVTLNLGDYSANFGADEDIIINLPEADVVLVGDFTNTTAELQVVAAKSITFGDGSTTTPTVINDGTTGLTLSDGTITDQIGAVGTLTLSNNAIYNGDVTTTEINTNIIISNTDAAGAWVGDIDMTATPKGKLTINGIPADAADIAVDGTVTTKGDVEIALGAEGEAISTKLIMQGANHNLILKSGLIAELEVDCISTAGQWEQRFVNVKLDEIVNDKSVAEFVTLTLKNDSYIKMTESLWSGAKITNTTYAKKYTNGTQIFTASQLATVTYIGTAVTLDNDLNLNSKTWPSILPSKNFTGVDLKAAKSRVVANAASDYPVIKNLKVDNTNKGFFTASNGDITVSGLTFQAANVAAAKVTGAGILFGAINHDVTVSAVKAIDINAVAGATDKGVVYELSTFGAIAGSVATGKTLILDDVTASGTITGYKELGGFVGSNAGTVNITKTTTTTCSSSVNISTNFDSQKAMDLNYAKIGGFVGTTSGTVNVFNGIAEPTGTMTHNTVKEYMSDTESDLGDFFDFVPNQKYVGYSGRNASNGFATGVLKTKSDTATPITWLVPNLGTNNKKGNPAKDLKTDGTEPVAYYFTARAI